MCYSALVKRDLEYLGRKYGAVIVREQIESYHEACAYSPKRFPPLESRIFPGHYAPVIFQRDGQRVIELMRYGVYPSEGIPNPTDYTTFNARRDNLTSHFWAHAYRKHHGFVVLERFYEWVKVARLLGAGVVSLKDIEAEFHRQAETRKARIVSEGKKYKPTPTELKPPQMRQIIIEFRPEDDSELVAPVIFSYGNADVGGIQKQDSGFAIVTDDPQPEIRDAGHDRCPVILDPGHVNDWLTVERKTIEELDIVLTRRQLVTFRHGLPTAV